MKSRLKIFTLILTLLSLFSLSAFVACNSTSGDVTITMDKKEVQLAVGESVLLSVSVKPDDVMDKTIEWKTSNEKIATVENGKVTAVAEGEAIVTATTNGKSDSCKITVTKAEDRGDEDENSGDSGSGSQSDEESQSGGNA